MAEDENALLVLSTFASLDEARTVARTLVEEHLAACAQLLPAIESIYRWKGAIETSGEQLVFFKTTRARYPALARRLWELHSYEVPEIVALPITHGLPEYLRWVAESCAR